MKRFAYTIILLGIFFGSSTLTLASTIKVDFTVEGQESIAVQKGDTIRVKWTSEASEPVAGCKGSGAYGMLTMNGSEWVTATLPTSGSAELKVGDLNATAGYFSVYCWLAEWPQNARFGYNVAQDQIVLLDKRVSMVPTGPVPVIFNLVPASGTVGTKVQITGSGFTKISDVAFVGAKNPVSETTADKVSLINGEYHYTNVNSADGKTLTFVVPSKVIGGDKGDEIGPLDVIPGMYYVVVETENGKSGVAYFKVTTTNEPAHFVSTPETFVLNGNLSLGSLGPEVTKLQIVLARDPSLYPEGRVTGYYGDLTKRAVQRFQCKYGLTCSGNVDLPTRQKMEQVFGNTAATNSQSTTGTSTGNSIAPNTAEQNEIDELVRKIRGLLDLYR